MSTSGQRGRLPSGRHGLPRDVIIRSQRERLLEAMIRVVSDKGYEGTTVADVIEAAGVSRTTFYELFGDKEECFLASYDAVADVLLAQVGRAFRERGGSWQERIHAGLAALVALLAEESAVARMAMVESIAASPAARQRYREMLGRFMPFLDEGRALSDHAVQLPAATSRMAIGGAAALIFDEVRAGRGDQLRARLPDLVYSVLMPFLGPETAAREMRRATAEI